MEPDLPYELVREDEPLRQGELLAGLAEPVISELAPTDDVPIQWLHHPLAILMTQDCDLDQDHAQRSGGVTESYRILRRVLLCEVSSATEVRNVQRKPSPSMPEMTSTIWGPLSKNLDDRFHFLEAVPATADMLGTGLDEQVVHFRRVFTVDLAALYAFVRRQPTTRRCRLRTPYAEHLAHRFSFYCSRVALPQPHHSRPG